MTEETIPKEKSHWLAGCSVGCLVLFVLSLGVGFGGYLFVKSQVNSMTKDFIKEGFQKKGVGSVVQIDEPITEKSLYLGQVVRVVSGSTADVAIISQVAEIHGKIDGNLYFRGQILKIMPDAEITGNVDVFAQVIDNDGQIGGEVLGTYQVIQNP